MVIEIEENSESKEQFRSVNAEVPDGVSVVPSGIEEQDSRQFVVYPDGTDTVRKLLEQNGVDYVSLDTEDDTSTLVLRSEEIIIPTIYIAYTFVRDNWDQIKWALKNSQDITQKDTIKTLSSPLNRKQRAEKPSDSHTKDLRKRSRHCLTKSLRLLE